MRQKLARMLLLRAKEAVRRLQRFVRGRRERRSNWALLVSATKSMASAARLKKAAEQVRRSKGAVMLPSLPRSSTLPVPPALLLPTPEAHVWLFLLVSSWTERSAFKSSGGGGGTCKGSGESSPITW